MSAPHAEGIFCTIQFGTPCTPKINIAESDDAFNAVGDRYEKVPLSLMRIEKKVLLPGYRSSASSVHAYVAAAAKVSQMARHVHVTAKQRGARVFEFLPSLEDNESVPERVRGSVPDIVGMVSALLNAADMQVTGPNVYRDNLNRCASSKSDSYYHAD
jgi:hypothetical protein